MHSHVETDPQTPSHEVPDSEVQRPQHPGCCRSSRTPEEGTTTQQVQGMGAQVSGQGLHGAALTVQQGMRAAAAGVSLLQLVLAAWFSSAGHSELCPPSRPLSQWHRPLPLRPQHRICLARTLLQTEELSPLGHTGVT